MPQQNLAEALRTYIIKDLHTRREYLKHCTTTFFFNCTFSNTGYLIVPITPPMKGLHSYHVCNILRTLEHIKYMIFRTPVQIEQQLINRTREAARNMSPDSKLLGHKGVWSETGRTSCSWEHLCFNNRIVFYLINDT
ncbi:hypothetical protein D910_00469 [Dendroctonus ponderosae]|uniref:Uncharacterized protein n=1 Tax=Dendroctonus ponderosae TaxID=77166 RepID=U4UZM7_DENPD|nr:hypothetical protein D910_00469 [Dendroctonus ponderosae]